MSTATDHAVSVNWLDYCNSQPDQKPALAACVELWDWTGSLNDTKTGAQNEAKTASNTLQATSHTF